MVGEEGAGIQPGEERPLRATAATETVSVWARYDDWNASVEAEFFDGSWAGRPVYLDMEDEVLEAIADRAGSTGDPKVALANAVRPTLYLPPETGGHLLDLHLRRLRRWQQSRTDDAPPCLAVLALFSMAAEGMRGDESFRSNNYYARLSQCVGINPKARAAAAKRVESEFRRDSLELWNGLNAWLRDHDGALGLPTAYSFDWRSYVGVPISQALLREEERLELRKLFDAYRLRPGQELAVSDMLRLLQEWLPRADVSPTLKRLFAQADAQARIADIACIELQAWDGSIANRIEGDIDPRSALLLAAQIRRVPRPTLTLSLVARGSSTIGIGEYILDGPAAGPAREAFSETAGRAVLLDGPSDGWRELQADGRISFPDLLIAAVHLTEPKSGSRLARKPRRLVILERDEEYRLAVEVDRAQLARENIVLAHNTLSSEVRQVLESCARAGWRHWRPGELGGLPSDWEAFSEVELIDIPDVEEQDADLSSLIPLEWTKIALGGGVSLPGYATWLREAPPEVRMTSFVDKDVTATLAQTMSLGQSALAEHELATFRGAAVFQLTADELEEGDYRVSLREAGARGKPLVSTAFRIRSANAPRFNVDLEGELGYRPAASAAGAISAELAAELPEPFIAGAALSPNPQSIDLPHTTTPPAFLSTTPEFDLETEIEATDLGVDARSGEAPSCLMGGGHTYALPEATRDVMLGKKAARKLDGRCKDCGFERWFPTHTRPAKPRGGSPPAPIVIQVAARATPVRPDVAAITRESQPAMDTLLAALSYARAGSWAVYERIAQQLGEEPWFSVESARTLASLGHIDLIVDSRTARVTGWGVTTPTLCAIADGAILAGARSSTLLSRLHADVEALEGSITQLENPDGPLTIKINGINTMDLQELAQSLEDAVGGHVHVNAAGAAGVAAALPELAAIEAMLPQLSPPDASLERFDLAANKWQPVGAIDHGGAYKLLTRPLRYGYVERGDGGGVIRSADNRLVKWLAACSAQQDLLAYDSASKLLLTRLGAQLPGLYERAAVLCSGRPPIKRIDGTVAYVEVTPEVASALYDRLCRTEPQR